MRQKLRLREKFKSVDVWLRKASGQGTTTARKYEKRFRRFVEFYNFNIDQLVAEWKKVRYDWTKRQQFLDEWTEKIENYYAYCEGSPLYKNSLLFAVLSFFRHQKIGPLNIDLNIKKYVIYHNRSIKKEEIRSILEHAPPRGKAFFLVMLESGLRPITVCKLQYKHIKEDFDANRIPMKIDTPAIIIKDNVGDRFTFIGKDGFRALKQYLSPRFPLSEEDYLFPPNKSWAKFPYVVPTSMSNLFSRIATELKLVKQTKKGKPKGLRLYCLRKYFRNEIGVEEAYRKFWMGRSLKTDTYYITRDIERHRKEYAKGYENLRVYQPETTKEIEILREENIKLKDALAKIVTEQKAFMSLIIDKGITTKEELKQYRILEKIVPEDTPKPKRKTEE